MLAKLLEPGVMLFSVGAFLLKPGPSVLKACGVCSAIVLASEGWLLLPTAFLEAAAEAGAAEVAVDAEADADADADGDADADADGAAPDGAATAAADAPAPAIEWLLAPCWVLMAA